MSGHSKWSTIKRQKGANDAKKGKIFTKLARDIIFAAQEGGGDVDLNFKLKIAVDKAKSLNMPSDNIERAIKKGIGELGGEGPLLELSYEAYGPGGAAIIIDVQTDNNNRAVTEIKNLLERNGGKFLNAGSVGWMFEQKGLIILLPRKFVESEKYGKEGEYLATDSDEMLMKLMDVSGVEDVLQEEGAEGQVKVTTSKDDLHVVHSQIETLGYQIISAELSKLNKEEVNISSEEQEKLLALLDVLYDSMEVNNVWHNANLD